MAAETESLQTGSEKPETWTARAFYTIRDLFIKHGSVYTARSLKLLPMGIALLIAVAFFGTAIYKFSHPISMRPSTGSFVQIPAYENQPVEPVYREAAEKPLPSSFPSNADIARRVIDREAPVGKQDPGQVAAGKVESFGGQRDYPDWAAKPEPPREYDGRPSGVTERENGGTDSGNNSAAESTMVFELGSADKVVAEQTLVKDYEYIDLINKREADVAGGRPEAGMEKESASDDNGVIATEMRPETGRDRKQTMNKSKETNNGKALEQDVRARLLTGIDTGLTTSRVVAEIAHDTGVGRVKLRAGDLIVGSVSRAGHHRVSVQFTKWLDSTRQEHEIDAEATDLDGMAGLRGRPADSRLKRAVLYSNERVLDYIRAIKGGIIFYNPAQSDITQIANRELVVEPNREFYLNINRIKELSSSKE